MMNRNAPPLLTFQGRRLGWLQRTALALGAIAVVTIAFFFITVALIAGALLALVIAVRFWWLMRRVRAAQHAAAPLETEYEVIDRSDEPRR